jgi:uncharacterized protein (DUF433 family)
VRKLFFAATSLMTLLLMFTSGAVAEDINPKQVEYAFRDYSSSPDVRNCSLAAYISNFPAPELVTVLFRVDASRPKNAMFFSITTDVGEQIYQSGKPSSIRNVPIDQAEFLSDGFDSLGRLHTTLDDGGVQQSTNDAGVFPILLLDFQSGHFTIRFRRQGSDAIRGYTVSSSMSDTMAATTQFRDCVKKLLTLFGGKVGVGFWIALAHGAQHSRETLQPQCSSFGIQPIPHPRPPPFAGPRQNCSGRSRPGPRSLGGVAITFISSVRRIGTMVMVATSGPTCAMIPTMEAAMIDWGQCPDVERIPGKVSGAWLVVSTRISADAVLDNAEDRYTAEQIVAEIYPSLPLDRTKRILAYARERANAPHPA